MSAHSTYTEWYGEMICAGLAEGRSLLATCEALGVSYEAARNWERDIPVHATNSARAREIGCHAIADDCLRIADTPEIGVERTVRADGSEERREGDMLQHRRLRIETRMRLLGKWLPKVYGDKQHVEHSGALSIADALREARERLNDGG